VQSIRRQCTVKRDKRAARPPVDIGCSGKYERQRVCLLPSVIVSHLQSTQGHSRRSIESRSNYKSNSSSAASPVMPDRGKKGDISLKCKWPLRFTNGIGDTSHPATIHVVLTHWRYVIPLPMSVLVENRTVNMCICHALYFR